MAVDFLRRVERRAGEIGVSGVAGFFSKAEEEEDGDDLEVDKKKRSRRAPVEMRRMRETGILRTVAQRHSETAHSSTSQPTMLTAGWSFRALRTREVADAEREAAEREECGRWSVER